MLDDTIKASEITQLADAFYKISRKEANIFIEGFITRAEQANSNYGIYTPKYSKEWFSTLLSWYYFL